MKTDFIQAVGEYSVPPQAWVGTCIFRKRINLTETSELCPAQSSAETERGQNQAPWLFTPNAGPNAARSLVHGNLHPTARNMPRPPSIQVHGVHAT